MKYYSTFKILDTEEQARNFCEKINSEYTAYMRKKHPATYTPLNGKDGSNGYIVWHKSLF